MRIRKLISLFLASFLSLNLSGQVISHSPEKIEKLRVFSEESQVRSIRQKQEAIEYAKKYNLPLKKQFADGRFMELQYIDDFGLPVYHITHNAGAANTVATNQLYSGGNLGLSLTGAGMKSGVWDAGNILSSHTEFSGRVILKETGETYNEHATHVAGTIAATGIQSGAKGMAYESTIHSYDWDNYLSEIATEAANGLLVSNHSYGIVLGWTWEDNKWVWKGPEGADEDYRFGYYSNNQSRSLDQIAYNAPYLLMVWSAGNDRNDIGDGSKEPDGPDDCIGPEAIAKNVLAVGSVEKIGGGYTQPSDVRMTTYSSWGPSDDGRVKPDIVAPGHQVYSTVATGGYGTKNGTSMAAPVVSGSLLLLQQLHNELFGNYLRAATLKGLVIHTANPAGASIGPDFEFGWGLLNTEGAARVILEKDNFNKHIRELTLANNNTYEFDFYADGTKSITATLSWTDPPGTPPPQVINSPNLMLVNDLDMIITDEAGNTYYPFIKEPGQTTGNNFRDNVEKIIIENPEPRKYTVRISHKGNLLSNSQDFSLILTTSALEFDGDPVFYWIGNSGNWNDQSKWSLSSGGPVANQLPGENDHVVFDENSFVEDGLTINISENFSCKSFSYLSKKEAIFTMNGNNVEINRFFLVSSMNGFNQNEGIFRITGGESRISIVSQKYYSFEIDNLSGSTQFLTNANIDQLLLKSGNIFMTNGKYALRNINTLGNEAINLDLSMSDIYNEGEFDFSASNLNVIMEGSQIFAEGNEGVVSKITGNDLSVKTITVIAGSLLIDANILAESVVNHGELTLNKGSLVHSLKLNPGSELLIGGGQTLEVLQLQVVSNEDDYVTFQSTSEIPANILYDINKKVCYDYLDIYNVTVSGRVTMVAGLNSLLAGTTAGWIAKACQDALYADFEVRFACERSRTEFIDKSTGQISAWDWNFGDPTNPQGTSELKNPYYTYQSTGTYPVTLIINDATDQKELTKDIEIKNNLFTTNSITVAGDVYTSVKTAIYYQWFLNGYPLSGAISRSFTNNLGLEGEFQVMLHDMSCNLFSEALIVNIEEQKPIENRFTVYPNPFQTNFTVEYHSGYTGIINYQLIDVWGRIILSVRKEKSDERVVFSEDFSALTPGIYFIRIIAGNETVNRKIIKTQ